MTMMMNVNDYPVTCLVLYSATVNSDGWLHYKTALFQSVMFSNRCSCPFVQSAMFNHIISGLPLYLIPDVVVVLIQSCGHKKSTQLSYSKAAVVPDNKTGRIS